MKFLSDDEVLNLVYALGITITSGNRQSDFIELAREIQAHTLNNFSTYIRETASKTEMITWADAALEAEFQQEYLGAITV